MTPGTGTLRRGRARANPAGLLQRSAHFTAADYQPLHGNQRLHNFRWNFLSFLLLFSTFYSCFATKTIVFSYDKRDFDEVPWLAGFREVNGLYAYRWGYEYRFYDRTRFHSDVMAQTWVKVFLGYQLVIEEFGACGHDAMEELKTTILGEELYQKVVQPHSFDHYYADDEDKVEKIRPDPKYLKHRGSRLFLGDFMSGKTEKELHLAQQCDNDFQIMFLDSDAVWHAHEISVESLFPEELLKTGGMIATAADVSGVGVPLPHTNAWVVRGELGREYLRKWRYQFKYIRHMWTQTAGEMDTCAGEKRWKCTSFVLEKKENFDEERATTQLASSSSASPSSTSSAGATTEVTALQKSLTAAAPRDCIYPYHGYDPMSLLSLIAESAYWDEKTHRVKFRGFEIPAWSRMNLPAPWNIAVRPMPNGKWVNGTLGHHFLTLEHDDTELTYRQNQYYIWWKRRRSGLKTKKWWVTPSSTTSAAATPTGGATTTSGAESTTDEIKQCSAQSHDAQCVADLIKQRGEDFLKTLGREQLLTHQVAGNPTMKTDFMMKMMGHDLIDHDPNSRAPELRPTFTVKRPLLSAGVEDEENEKTLSEYNERSMDSKQALVGLATHMHLSEHGEHDASVMNTRRNDNKKMVTIADKSYPVVYPVRWVLCAHFHWKNRANYTMHNCDQQRYTPLTFLYFTDEYMRRHWPAVKFTSRPSWLLRIDRLKLEQEEADRRILTEPDLLEKNVTLRKLKDTWIEPEAKQRSELITLFERWAYAGLLKSVQRAPVEVGLYPQGDLGVFEKIARIFPSTANVFGRDEHFPVLKPSEVQEVIDLQDALEHGPFEKIDETLLLEETLARAESKGALVLDLA
ncbi:unnamed protein product [Amoebophrya sp. A120]|nr:unnamed protein product [Amoebophrya sp. A120]|eukprot:GSA120T00001201001.1